MPNRVSGRPQGRKRAYRLLVGDGDVARVDGLDNVVRRLAIDSAADRLRCAKDLLYAVSERAGQRLGLHRPCNIDDLIEGDVASVLDVLLLFAVARRLCDVNAGALVSG